ncbi:thioredoxin fold domain-containing protein [Winogradskyella sp.]|uniref:thioredoxin family protein n=1 Tax=Winogradskyella sp. TaxID=1883156 RepID=UPI0025E5DD71|nr:thioredoxin fold domain-containing protein [Winogradskyella sp.]
MRKLGYLVLVVLLASFKPMTNEASGKINWVTIEEAIELQKTAPKKIIMDVYTNWCGPCKMLDKNTFQNEDVANYVNEHFYAVKFNGEGNESVTYKDKTFGNPNYDATKVNRRNSAHEFSRYLKVRAYPTMVFFDEEANFITPVTGYLKPQQLELYLKLFKNDDHKNMDTQEKFNEYYKSFKAEFKE